VAEPVRMPLADAARALGTTPDALRQKIKRGKLQAVRDNTGRLMVWVDADAILAVEVSSRSVGVQSKQLNESSGHVKSLEDHVKSLTARLEVADRQTDQQRADHKAELERLRAVHAADLERVEARLIEERAQLQDQLQEALAEANHAKSDQVRMARDVSMMFDELKALADKHAAVHADQVRLQVELDQARAELVKAQRPWWRRLIGQ
jgi:chromosome segregation ATPase